MSSGKLLGWLKQGITKLVDSDRDERTDQLAKLLRKEITGDRSRFVLPSAVSKLQIDDRDIGHVTEKVYIHYLSKAWEDDALSEREREGLDWVANRLQIPPQVVKKLNLQKGVDVFERLLASAIEDGHVDEHETIRLESICDWIGIPVGGMIRRFFLEEGEGFLRGVFLSAIVDGNLIEEEWSRLLECADRLGLTNDELLASIESHATRFLEHVLADAKADGRLSQAEDRNVSWLLQTFRLPPQQRTYFESELAELRIYTGIEEGRLPSIPPPPDTGIRAGEIIHHWGPATYHVIRQRKSGPVVESFDGQVTVTDNRLIFSSALKSTTLKYSSVVECRERSNGVELRSASKGGGLYDFKDGNRLAFAILRTAIGRANQTIVERRNEPPSRHIPRDVRQRVWQRYGGRCAVCGSDQYLEFDHIIPVAKGGSNSDANVQLLCRRHNLDKLDNI